MTTTISVPFEEHEDSPIENGDINSGLKFSRVFLVNHEDRFVFLTQMFTGGIDGRPKAYHNAFPDMLATSFSVERIENKPFGPMEITDPESQIIGHSTLAKITIDYAIVQYMNGEIATYSRSGSVEFIDLPGRLMKWESSGKRPLADISPVLPIANTAHEITFHQVSSAPWGQMEFMKGKVNSSNFYIPAIDRNIPRGHLLYLEDSSTQTLKFDGSIATTVSIVFVEKNQSLLSGSSFGWNHKLNPETGEYDRLVSDAGHPLFQEANLISLFT